MIGWDWSSELWCSKGHDIYLCVLNFPRIYLCSLSHNLTHKQNLTFCESVFLLTVLSLFLQFYLQFQPTLDHFFPFSVCFLPWKHFSQGLLWWTCLSLSPQLCGGSFLGLNSLHGIQGISSCGPDSLSSRCNLFPGCFLLLLLPVQPSVKMFILHILKDKLSLHCHHISM